MSLSKSKEPQRIAKLLARAGIASRREIERMIAEGRIALNGVVVDTPATLLPSLRGVTVDGNPVAEAAPARLFIFHKPSGVLTTERDPAGRRTIYDVLPTDLPRLVPVGRLDLNTEGLLLMTTDGELKRQLELPSSGVERTYRARAYGDVTQAQLEELIEGVEVEGVRYGSIDANLERRTGANVWVEMTLTEGKNREVRRVLEHLGLQVSRLIRVRYGPYVLGELPVGAIGEVRQHDLVAFRKMLKLPSEKRVFEPVAAHVAKPKVQAEPAEQEPRHRAAAPGKPARAERARAFREQREDEAGERPTRHPAGAARPARATPDARKPMRAGGGADTPERAQLGREDRSERKPTRGFGGPGKPGRPQHDREERGERKSLRGSNGPGKPGRPQPDREARAERQDRPRATLGERKPRSDTPRTGRPPREDRASTTPRRQIEPREEGRVERPAPAGKPRRPSKPRPPRTRK